MLLTRYEVFGNKKSKFIKEQDVSGLLSQLDIKTPLKKIPLLGDIFPKYIINKFLLAGDKFISEMHLRQPNLCILLVGHLQKTKEYKN